MKCVVQNIDLKYVQVAVLIACYLYFKYISFAVGIAHCTYRLNPQTILNINVYLDLNL